MGRWRGRGGCEGGVALEFILVGMSFHIDSDEADRLLRELQVLTGESIAEFVTKALAARLEREKELKGLDLADPLVILEETWARVRQVPILDARSAEEILGYGADGMPGRVS